MKNRRWSVAIAAAVVAWSAGAATGTPRAKNVILMISDGAGDTTWRAANQWQFGTAANTAPEFSQVYERSGFTRHWMSTHSGFNQPLPPGQTDVRLGLPAGSLPRTLPRLWNEIPFPNAGSYDPARANDATIGDVHLFADRRRNLLMDRGAPLNLTPVASNPALVRTLANQLQTTGQVTVRREQAPRAYDYLIWDSVTDSAAAGTAFASGVKTYNSAINVRDTGTGLEAVPFITQQVKALGKKAGVVTTKPFTDATPAVFGTQNDFRDDEAEISGDMIGNGLLDVVISPGHPEFQAGGVRRPTPQFTTVSEANLGALRSGTAGGGATPWTLVESNAGLEGIASGATPAPGRLFGLVPTGGGLNDRDTSGRTNAYDPRFFDPANPRGAVPFVMPDLDTLSMAAINTLKQDPDGFFLMIEGASVDTAAHANNLAGMVEEQLAFNRAVERVVNWVETESSWDETLLIITTDHANGLFLGPDSASVLFQDPIATGVGELPRGIFWTTNHTNELVPLFARGVGSELFAGLFDGIDPRRGPFIDNTDVYTVMSTVIPAPGAALALAAFGLAAVRRRRGR